jgi:hypothetical protein
MFQEDPACVQFCPNLSFKQRVMGFLACAAVGTLMSFMVSGKWTMMTLLHPLQFTRCPNPFPGYYDIDRRTICQKCPHIYNHVYFRKCRMRPCQDIPYLIMINFCLGTLIGYCSLRNRFSPWSQIAMSTNVPSHKKILHSILFSYVDYCVFSCCRGKRKIEILYFRWLEVIIVYFRNSIF